MINFRDITKALETQIKNYNTDAQPYTIVRNKVENHDPNIAAGGWIGIYRDSVGYSPHSTGPHPWLTSIDIRIEIQAASIASEEDCEKKLDAIVLFVMQATESDRSIGGYVAIVKEYNIDYDDSFAVDQLQTFYQYATITITAEVRS